MSEPFDVYFDQLMINFGAYGAALTFQLSQAKPPPPGTIPPSVELGTARTSLEHLKVMVFILKRQIEQVENELGIQFPVSFRILNQLQISPEDWNKFWRKD